MIRRRRVRRRAKKGRKGFARACLDEAVAAGSDLVEPRCAYHGVCGGCTWQRVAYSRQLEFKREWVRRAFHTAGFTELAIPAPLPSEALYAYRNKMEFSFSPWRWFTTEEIASGDELRRDFALGLHAPNTFRRVLDVADCPIQSEEANRLLRATREFALGAELLPFHPKTHEGLLRHLVLRRSPHTGQSLALLVTARPCPETMAAYLAHLERAGLRPTCVANGITQSIADTTEGMELVVHAGPPYLEERIGELVYRLAPDAFFQTNTRGAERLVALVRELAAPQAHERVWDLYAGVGTLSLALAGDAGEVLGLEQGEAAVACARENARLNGIEGVRFLARNLNEGLPDPGDAPPQVVVTDPPRAGMHPKALLELARLGAERLVSVGCNATTHARDLAQLCAQGYTLAHLALVDLFPHTPHVETVALLKRAPQ